MKNINNQEKNQIPLQLFHQGTNPYAYEFLGVHKTITDGAQGMVCRVWAPNAASASIVGDFNEWNPSAHPMKKISDGVWECTLPFEFAQFEAYKFLIEDDNGNFIYKSDPYAHHFETRPGTASKYYDLSGYQWNDSNWYKEKEKHPHYEQPVNIYEIHLGSWKRYQDGHVFSYEKIADELIPYIKEMGYTHIELMPITEYPYDGSWGYQVTGYFAPTSRYGEPNEFMKFVDRCHQAGIGVIMDWVPAHFPKDEHGLAEFDGTATYEYADPRKGEHPDWGTKIFDLGKNEVRNFLIANALFWVEHFHIDGLRVDAVASMLYLDYGKKDGEWVPNQYGGNENLEAVDFFKHLNTVVLGRNPGALMIAEESTAWPKVTGDVEDGGLGFSLKWNMGWMHDFTEYMKLDPYFRKDNHHMMTFAMSYAYSEDYILVLSHDEVVHLKCSMINKMPGLGFDKYANLKAGYAFMMGHAGKKLLFMGQDFAQLREWSEERELDWYLLEEPEHQAIQSWMRDLLHMYKKKQALYELDQSWEGFEWVNADDAYRSIYSFIRHSKDGKHNLLFVINFTPMAREDYRVGVPRKKQYKLILNSDDVKYGGNGEKRQNIYHAVKKECDGRPYSFGYKLPPYGVAVFEF